MDSLRQKLKKIKIRSRLWLGLAAASAQKKISSLSLFMRRSSNLAATDVGEKMKLESESGSELKINKEKNLYLCFLELGCSESRYANQVVRPIRLNSNDDGDEEEEEDLVEVTFERYMLYNWESCRCSTFGSKILFSCGPQALRICWIDTSTPRPITFQFSSPTKTFPNRLKGSKHTVMLGEVDRKLYRLDHDIERFQLDPDSRAFEVFDPENGDKWRPLATPPFMRNWYSSDYNVTFLDASKKILGWESRKPGVFCFDATKPENSWTDLGDNLPFRMLRTRPFFVHNHHPDLGDFHLTFIYQPAVQPLQVFAFFMSNNFDTFLPFNKPIELPALCSKYVPNKSYFFVEEYDFTVSSDFEFVRLGAQKVGLVLNKYFEGENTGFLLLVTFEYDIITTVKNFKPTLEIRTRLVRTRRFRYDIRQLHKRRSTSRVSMNGAFVL